MNFPFQEEILDNKIKRTFSVDVDSEELVVGDAQVVTYTEKSLTQFFGCSGVTTNLESNSAVRANVYAYGTTHSGQAKFRVTGVLSDLNILKQVGPYEKGDKIYIDRPTILDKDGNPIIMTPQDARLKNLTYSTRLYTDVMVRYTIAGKEAPIEKRFNHILLGEIPLMVHSDGCILHQQGPKVLQSFDECPFDQGGYFIVDGKEKVVISQERMVTNRLFLEKPKMMDEDLPNYSYKGWVRCTAESGETALLPKTIEFYVIHPDKHFSTNPEYENYKGAILVSLPNLRDPENQKTTKVPLFQLFRAFGIESDKEILEHIFGVS